MAEYPKALTPELRDVLGMMVFQLSPVAHLFRDNGADIKRRAEDEQAFVLHWLIGLVLEHGPGWASVAGQKVAEMQKAREAADNQGTP
jgi:hypothetical protein